MAMTFVLRLFFIHAGFTAVATVIYSCLSNETCGCSLNSAFVSKIVGGEQAQTDSWGWAASIRVGNNHICGGSLISSTLILTAAHCLMSIQSKSSLNINLGSKKLSLLRQQRSVSNMYIHQEYDENTFVNDIAMIRLSSSVDMTDRSIALICLPSVLDTNYPPINTSVVAIGWGVLASGDNMPSDTLQQVTLKTISYTAMNCRTTVNNDTVQFCAGVQGGGKDTCQGDSGGPLMMFSNSQWILVGITSYGAGCALAHHPGVYTRVSYYQNWISCFLTDNTSCVENTTSKEIFIPSVGSSIFYQNICVFFLGFALLKSGVCHR